MKILIADDDPVTLKLLERILSSEPDYEIEKAEDGQACWELLESGYLPDVCLLDIEMPRLSGLDLLERMRNREEFSAIPVLIVTAHSDIDSQASAAALRSFAFIVKPFNPNRVLAVVSEAIVSTRKHFQPYGFKPVPDTLKNRKITLKQYLKQMVIFVRMVGSRIDDLDTLVNLGDWRALQEALKPVSRLAEFLGAEAFSDHFTRITKPLFEEKEDSVDCSRRHLLRMRAEFDELKRFMESYLNVVIKAPGSSEISTKQDGDQEERSRKIELSAKLIDRAKPIGAGGFDLGQAIEVVARRGKEEVARLLVETDDKDVVLKTSVASVEEEETRRHELKIFLTQTLDKALKVSR